MTGVSVPRLVVIEPEVRTLSQNTETLQIMVAHSSGDQSPNEVPE